MNRSFTEALKLGAIVVPAGALISANLYFMMLSARVGIIPLAAFSLQDHFDKAIDLLIPGFIFWGVSLAIVIHIAENSPPLPARIVNAPWAVKISLRIFLLLLGLAILWTAALEDCWYALLPFMMVTLPIGPRAITKYGEKFFGWDPEKIWKPALFVTMAAFLIFIGLILTVDSSLSYAKYRHFDTQEKVLIDGTSLGILVLDDGRFKLEQPDGHVLITGEPIPTKSESAACKAGWTWACATTIDFTKSRR